MNLTAAPPRSNICNGKLVVGTLPEAANETEGEMIKVVLVFTESGDLRFFKFYDEMGDGQRAVVRDQLMARVQKRNVTGEIFECADLLGEDSYGVFRQVGSLVVLFGADGAEPPLYTLDLVDAFIHALRAYFGRADQVVERAFTSRLAEVSDLLDEMVQGGLVLETDPDEAVRHLRAQLDSRAGLQAAAASFLSGLARKFRK